jgi:hypothetical protein
MPEELAEFGTEELAAALLDRCHTERAPEGHGDPIAREIWHNLEASLRLWLVLYPPDVPPSSREH